MGFIIFIKNSRWFKKIKDFIDVKFVCFRYGFIFEFESGSSSGWRLSVKKIDCKVSMYVKRKLDGRWIIYEFIKEYNYEFLFVFVYYFWI